MSEPLKVAKATQIPEGQGLCVEAQGKRIALFRCDGGVYAIDDGCTHMGASLAEGSVDGMSVICPWHGAHFDLHSGAASGPPARGGVKTYPCRIEGDDVVVEV